MAAHDQKVTHSYVVHYPAHTPASRTRTKHDFEWIAAPHHATDQVARFREVSTAVAMHRMRPGSWSSITSAVELAMLERHGLRMARGRLPGIRTSGVGAWIDGDHNLMWLCERCHRGHGGVQCRSADYEAEKYIRGLIG